MRTGSTFRRLAWGAPVLILTLAVIPPSVNADPDRTRLDAKRAAAQIDRLIDKALRERGLKPNGIADDATFTRRSYLTIAGRIPTGAELAGFTRRNSSEKHFDLVDELLASKGHESRMFNWWADLLRTRSRQPRRISGEPYIHWVKQAIADNKPYDRMVHQLLSASGAVHERNNGATGYLMRDRNMPEDNMSNTIRLFVGSRVECAQCHNHPFDKWTQKQYFEMVAFTGGIRYQKNIRQDERVRRLNWQAQERWGRNGVRALRRTLEPTATGIFGSGTGAARLPKDYQYDDSKPNAWVTAHPIFGPQVNLTVGLPDETRIRERMKRRNPKKMARALRRMRAKEVDSRTAFADWITSPQNERFSKVIANRIWKLAMGRGLIEPVDDIKGDTEPVLPELMDHLTELMIDVDFDLREFQRVLYYTRFWRRRAAVPADAPGKLEDLRGPLLRRMTAEQAWDSLLTLVVSDLDGTLRPPLSPRAEAVYKRFEELSGGTDEEILERTGQLALRYSDPAGFRKQQQAARAKQRQEMRTKRREARPLYRELAQARRAGDQKRVQEISAELRERGLVPPGARGGRALRDLQRASDLPSPAPNGHLLRELGQGERDLIQDGHVDPTVPQILALLNAFLEQRLLTNRDAILMRDLSAARGPKARVKLAFLSVLGRPPAVGERSMWERDVKSDPRGVQDLVWTLVNTHEFLFVQ